MLHQSEFLVCVNLLVIKAILILGWLLRCVFPPRCLFLSAAALWAALDLLLSLDELHLKLFFLRNAKLMGVSLSSLNTNTLAHVLQVSLPEAKVESIEPFSEMLLLPLGDQVITSHMWGKECVCAGQCRTCYCNDKS